MKEFKGTKGIWTVEEHSWSDTSLMCGEKTIATMSIYHDATEETQEELENEVTANFNLLAAAPELLEALQEAILCLDRYCIPETSEELKTLYLKSKNVINRALGIKE